uniref:Protein odr-4 homolog n=1 Tax=Phallusia mammillata TaxID=59560 RepID=A0A6F9D8S7_9ASCI|nr:protein odr-4 homolog [Phallusia mammillata]
MCKVFIKMVRIIVAEETCAESIRTWRKQQEPVVGLILGKTTSTKDYIIKFVRCPAKSETSSKVLKIEDNWVAGHAVEVSHILPGGISVIGLFAVADPSSDKTLQSSLRQALYCTYSFINHSCPYKFPTSEGPKLWTVIHFDMTSGRSIFSKQFDMLDRVSSAKPVDLKYQQPCSRWSFLNSHVDIDITIPLAPLASTNVQCLQAMVWPFCDQILNSSVLLNGAMMNDSDMVDPEITVKSGKGHKQKHKQSTLAKWGKTHSCEFFLHNDDNESDQNGIDLSKASQCIKLCGSFYTCAYVPLKTPVSEAIEELKFDLIRSVFRRCSLVCEELQDQNRQLTSHQYVMFPRRVGFPKQNTDEFQFSEYQFHGEPLEDCVARIQETFDEAISVDDINNALEEFKQVKSTESVPKQDTQEMIDKDSQRKDVQIENGEMEEQAQFPIRALLAAGTAVLAVVLSYLSLAD